MNTKCNITNIESYIRLIVSAIILIIAVATENYFFMIISMLLAYTGIKKHCYLYDLIGINKKLSLKNYYMAHLPKYNPSSVFMFRQDGSIFFQNKSSKEDLGQIKNISDLKIKSIKEIIENEKEVTQYFDFNNRYFQLDLKGLEKINSILLYATDITKLVNLNKEIEKTQKEIIYKMGEVGETRSKETGNHVKRVAQYSHLLALLYGLDEKEANKLKLASPMHDIGKVGIPDNILNKPGKHDAKEWKIMKTHAGLGYKMLRDSDQPIIQAAAIVAHEHHEKWDGSGYPRKLSGEDIHIFGRITAVADVFDALGSKRVYKEAWELEKILDLFKEQKGKHFEPKLVELFIKNLDQFLVIRDKYKDT